MKKAQEMGQLVKPLLEKPRLDREDFEYWYAFQLLSSRRTYSAGMSAILPNPIQFSEIESWLNLQGIADQEDRLDYMAFVLMLDDEWIRDSREKAATQNDRKDKDVRRTASSN